MNMNKFDELVNKLVKYRRKYKLFTITKCSKDCMVERATVYNFENNKTINYKVLTYYSVIVLDYLKKENELLFSDLIDLYKETVYN